MCKDTFWALAEAKPLGCDGKITRAPLIGVTVLVPAVAVKIIIPLHHMISIFFLLVLCVPILLPILLLSE